MIHVSGWWQIALVVVIELLALAFLVSRLFPRRPRVLTKPDVKVSALVRKKKSPSRGEPLTRE